MGRIVGTWTHSSINSMIYLSLIHVNDVRMRDKDSKTTRNDVSFIFVHKPASTTSSIFLIGFVLTTHLELNTYSLVTTRFNYLELANINFCHCIFFNTFNFSRKFYFLLATG